MSRRFGTEKTLHTTVDPVSGGAVALVINGQTDIILQPKSAVISSHAGGPLEFNLLDGSGVFLHGHVPSNTSITFPFPEGLELTKSSGISIQSVANDGSITLYYCMIDESPGITKVASRAASYQASLGAKAVRRPSVRAVGDES